ncbi:MAG: hypothetical protein AAF432_08815 [Planctomycetota bacterium]
MKTFLSASVLCAAAVLTGCNTDSSMRKSTGVDFEPAKILTNPTNGCDVYVRAEDTYGSDEKVGYRTQEYVEGAAGGGTADLTFNLYGLSYNGGTPTTQVDQAYKFSSTVRTATVKPLGTNYASFTLAVPTVKSDDDVHTVDVSFSGNWDVSSNTTVTATTRKTVNPKLTPDVYIKRKTGKHEIKIQYYYSTITIVLE